MNRRARTNAVALAMMTVIAASQPCLSEIRPSDYSITTSIERALKRDLRLRDSDIKVKTTSGKVTLSGVVPGYIEKDRAERLCERVDGVEAVKSDLRVQLLPHSDDEIAQSIRQRFRDDIVLRDQELDVDVHRQIVTIKGKVEDDSLRQRAEQLARRAPSVTLVRNELLLLTSARRDDDIRAGVVANLDWDGSLSGFPVSLSVDRGVVTLEGVVRYRWQRKLAGRLSQAVAGVHKVDNHLEVMINDQPDAFSAGKRAETHVGSVTAALNSDRLLDTAQVHVTSDMGNIVLSGTVPNLFQRRRAAARAMRCTGVISIENQLVIDDEPRTDVAIAKDVQRAFSGDAVLANECISVVVDDGIVTLSAEVDDFTPKHHAMRLTAPICGIRSITNGIKVRWSPAFSDDALAKRVMRRLRENPVTQQLAENVNIQVVEGTVTLSGRVDSSPQRNEIVHTANCTDGVRSVVDEIEVKN